uniref:Trafficking protein particle complex subunit n=1 Tax=Mantoniella antarctica TaxID=81844 RepID=A0A7S0SSC7_9CHLO
MEAMGFQVGTQLAERYTKDRPRFTEQTEVILFLCKEFWLDVFKKRVDNLKTNNRGVYVLQDNAFRWMRNLHAIGSTQETGNVARREYAASCTYFPSGIIQGLLVNLGLPCTVTGDAGNLPGCTYTVRLKGSAP